MNLPPEPRNIALTGCVLASAAAFITQLIAAPSYNPDVTTWQEIKPPPKSRTAQREMWISAANYSNVEWQIKRDGNSVRANLVSNPVTQSFPRPNFVPKAEQFTGAGAVQRIDDGWLVGFNHGEFGAALYWFSPNGQQKYKISNDQVVDFLTTPQGVFAIQGLAHLVMSEGSLIRVVRDPQTARWTSRTTKKLPEAPTAFVRLSNGSLILVLTGSLVSLSPSGELATLYKEANWTELYANSAVLSGDESKLYIGMRQFVAEVDLRSKTFKYLIPNRTFLNKLSKEEEQQVRESLR